MSLVRETGRGRPFRFPEKAIDVMTDLYRAGASQEWISARFGCSQNVVSRLLRIRGVTRPRPQNRDGHGNWKGGRISTSGGYIGIWVDIDHPFAAMRHRAGYVLEHRLKMAEKLGRPLHADETVHHKDGDRTNNAFDNLELWVGRHGKGATSPHCHTCRCFTED